jgi:hypothetical protein
MSAAAVRVTDPWDDESVAGRGPRRRAASWPWLAGSLAVYVLLAVGLFAVALTAPQTRVIGSDADPGVISWYLGWLPFALSHGMNPLLSTYIDFPAGVNLLWNTWVPLPALLLWPVTTGPGPIVSYNIAAALAPALAAWCAWFACRRYVRSRIAAMVGGLLYGFSPYMLAHSLGHLHLSLAFVPPLMLLALDEALIRQSRPVALLGTVLGVLGLTQLLISEEILVGEGLTACMAIAILIALYGKPARHRVVYASRALGLAALVFLIPAAPLLVFQFLGPQHITAVPQPRNVYVTDLLNFVLPTNVQAVSGWVSTRVVDQFTGNAGEWGAYLGLPLLAILVYAARRDWQRRAVRAFSMLGLFLAVLSMGQLVHVAGRITLIPVPILGLVLAVVVGGRVRRPLTYVFVGSWIALAIVPGFDNILPARLTVFVFLFGAVLLAWFCDMVLREHNRRRLLGLAATLVALVTLLPQIPFPASAIEVPTFFTTSAVHVIPAGSVALVAPYALGGSTDAMVWQAASRFRFQMPEGYAWHRGSTSSPDESQLGFTMASIARGAEPTVNEADRQQLLAELSRWRVTTVIVGPMAHRDRIVAFFSWLFARPPTSVADVELWPVSFDPAATLQGGPLRARNTGG